MKLLPGRGKEQRKEKEEDGINDPERKRFKRQNSKKD